MACAVAEGLDEVELRCEQQALSEDQPLPLALDQLAGAVPSALGGKLAEAFAACSSLVEAQLTQKRAACRNPEGPVGAAEGLAVGFGRLSLLPISLLLAKAEKVNLPEHRQYSLV